MDVYARSVETQTQEVDSICSYGSRQSPHLASLALIRGVVGIDRAGRRTNLDGDLDVSVHHQQVDLAPLDAHIGRDDRKPLVGEIPSGETLAESTKGTATVV